MNVSKRYLIAAMPRSLWRILHRMFGMGKTRRLQDLADLTSLVHLPTRRPEASGAMLTTDAAPTGRGGPCSRRVNHHQQNGVVPGAAAASTGKCQVEVGDFRGMVPHVGAITGASGIANAYLIVWDLPQRRNVFTFSSAGAPD